MGHLRILLGALLAASALAVLAGPAYAVVAAASNPGFCKSLGNLSATRASQPTKAQAKQAAQSFKSVAKHAPAKIKPALSTIANFLTKVANNSDPNHAAELYQSADFTKYTKAISAFLKYTETTCAGS